MEKHNRLSVCLTLRRAGVLVPLSKAARNVGVFMHKSESMAYRLLKGLKTPVVHVECPQFTDKNGKQQAHYYFVLNNHEGTKKAFADRSFDAFRTNPVEILGRMPDVIPTTYILNDPGFISAAVLLREIRINIRPREARKYLGPDCPVPVFYICSKRLLVRNEDADALADYLGAKLAQTR